jgi:hypothetical protein
VKKGRSSLFIQSKKDKRGVKAMSQPELIKLREHADQYGCIGIYIYTDSKKKYLYDTMLEQTFHLKPIPKKDMLEWVAHNKKLKESKNILSCNCYINDTIKHIYL